MQTCMALYDWDGQFDQANWLSLVLNFFEKSGIQPNIAVVCTAEGKWSKPISLRTLHSRIAKHILMQYIEIYSVPENYKTMNDSDAGTLFEDSGVAPNGKRTLVVSVPGELDSKKLDFFHLYGVIAQQCKPRYGIIYEMKNDCGPIYYGLGIIQSSEECQIDQKEREKIGMWFRERIESSSSGPKNRHLLGRLRDVYRINIISESHLNSSVNGATLKQWILNDSSRGLLKEINANSYWWEIPLSSIKDVRDFLSQQGLVICGTQEDTHLP